MQAPNPFRSFVMGNGTLLVQCAEALLKRGHEVLGVVTDNADIETWAEGRGLRVIAPGPSKTLAERLGDAPFEWLFSIANLAIIPEDVLALPSRGAINFHDGPLPRYAGLNVPVWAILNGERTHGISWHVIEGGVDEGDVVAEETFEIAPEETCLTLNTRCYEAAIASFEGLADQLGRGEPTRRAQDLTQRQYFGKFDRPAAACSVDLGASASSVHALVRALDHGRYPNPVGTPKLVLEHGALLLPAATVTNTSALQGPGTVVSVAGGALELATANGALRFEPVLDADGETLDAAGLEALGLRAGVQLSMSASQREALSALDKELARHEDFWARRLSDAQPARLPSAAFGSAAETPAQRLPLGDTDSAATLLAAVSALVGRLSGKVQLDFGYRHAALEAQLAETAGASSLYAERVPLRVQVPRDSSFEALCAAAERARETTQKRGTFLRDLYRRRPGSARPVWEFLFDEVATLSGYALPANAVASIVTDGAKAELVFDPARLSPEAAGQLVSQLDVVRRAAAAAPDTLVGKLPLLSEDERRTLLTTWNATSTEYASELGVHQLFEAQVDRTPDAVALVHRATELTYAQLDARSNQLAHHLIGLGVTPDAPVGLYTDRSVDLVVGALAVLKAGGAYVPLDPTYPADRIALMLSDSKAAWVLTQRELEAQLPSTQAQVVHVDAEGGALAAQPITRPSVSTWTSANLAYLIYTSGSTGTPKGVMVEHQQVGNFFVGMDARIPHEPGSTWLAVTSLSFDISVLELFYTLARGFRVVLAGDEDRGLVSGGESVPRANERSIDFSLFYFASDEGEHAADKYKLLLDGARFADENGFSAVWTPERHFHAFGGLYPNPAVASAAIATITKRVRIRAGSCVSPLHHPARIAEEWGLVDNLSNGRVDISFAAGWQPNDFLLRPQSFGRQKDQMLEDIDTIRRLWRGESVSFDAPTGPVEVRTLPRPIQPELPFMITAAGNPETFELAGRLGGGILTHLLGQSLEDVQTKIAIYRKAWKDAGHAGEGLAVLMLHTFIGEDDAAVKELVREPMKDYLRSSIALIQSHAWAFPAFKAVADESKSFSDNFENLSEEDTEALLDHSFERYYETSSLFGTPDSARRMVEACRAAGVDEIGCLIDFGVDSATVMESLPSLNRLRHASSDEALGQGGVDTFAPDDYSIAAQLVRHEVSHLQCTPSMARMLVTNDESRRALAGLSHMMVGGEALPLSLARDLRAATQATLTNMYGPTETTIWSSTSVVDPAEGQVTLGTPIANTQLYVLDEALELVAPGMPGELYIAGDGVTRPRVGL